MNAQILSTGISVQWPRKQTSIRSPASLSHSIGEAANDDDHVIPTTSESNNHIDDSVKSECRTIDTTEDSMRKEHEHNQEVAYQYVVEKAAHIVNSILTQENALCYKEVSQYFQQYVELSSYEEKNGQQLLHFPNYHGIPTAGMVTGSDVSSSELWLQPLERILYQTFPLVFRFKVDAKSARQVIEWLVEEVDKVLELQERERKWLLQEIEVYNHSFRQKTVRINSKKGTGPMCKQYATLTHRSSKIKRTTRSMTKCRFPNSDDPYHLDDDIMEETLLKNQRRKKSSGKKDVLPHAKWTVDRLLQQFKVDALEVCSQQCGDSVPDLLLLYCDMILSDLKSDLDEEFSSSDSFADPNAVSYMLQQFHDLSMWVAARITYCRENFSINENNQQSATLSKSLEIGLAKLLHKIMAHCLTFLKTVSKTSLRNSPGYGSLINSREQKFQREFKRLVDMYHLQDSSSDLWENTTNEPEASIAPFLILCVEDLDSLNREILSDFLTIWKTTQTRDVELSSNLLLPNLGLILGIASPASPSLSRLGQDITSHIKLRYFSLHDSQACFTKILSSLVVDSQLPLQLSGDILKLVSKQYYFSQSMTKFLHSLNFCLFLHFQKVPWSFLCQFIGNMNEHVDEEIFLQQRHNLEESLLSLPAVLERYADMELQQLWKDIDCKNSNSKNRVELLRHINHDFDLFIIAKKFWAASWTCLLGTYSSLFTKLLGLEFVQLLALAVDGQITFANDMIAKLWGKLSTLDIASLAPLLRNIWLPAFRKLISEVDTKSALLYKNIVTTIEQDMIDLILVCSYWTDHMKDSTDEKQRIEPHVRQEITDFFYNYILRPLSQNLDQTIEHILQQTTKSKKLLKILVVKNAQTASNHLELDYLSTLKSLLHDVTGVWDKQMSKANSNLVNTCPSWVRDVSLLFLAYEEEAGLYISRKDWYETFATTLLEEEGLDSDSNEVKARFVRAFCTLRHWGFVKAINLSSRSTNGASRETILDQYDEKMVCI